MTVRLEMRTIDLATSKVLRYQAVETTDRNRTIEEFSKNIDGPHDPAALSELIEQHDEFWIGDRFYSIYEVES